MASVLLAAGADPVARNKYGETPLMHHAFLHGTECVQMLLLQGPRVVDAINAQTNALGAYPGSSALHLVFILKNGNEAKRARVAELLLRHGADPNLRNAKGQTPLDVLREKDATDHVSISLLESAMAKAKPFLLRHSSTFLLCLLVLFFFLFNFLLTHFLLLSVYGERKVYN
jgi:ankyrin repeat protein